MDISEDYPFSDLLRQFRVRAHLTQKDVAEKLEVHLNTYGAWERGNGRPQNSQIVLKLADVLHLSEEEKDKLIRKSHLSFGMSLICAIYSSLAENKYSNKFLPE